MSAAAVYALQVSFQKFQLFLGDIWLCLLRLRVTFSVSSWLALRSLEQQLSSDGSRNEREHLISGCRFQECSAHTSGQGVRKRDPEYVLTAPAYMVLVSSFTRECTSVQQPFGS